LRLLPHPFRGLEVGGDIWFKRLNPSAISFRIEMPMFSVFLDMGFSCIWKSPWASQGRVMGNFFCLAECYVLGVLGVLAPRVLSDVLAYSGVVTEFGAESTRSTSSTRQNLQRNSKAIMTISIMDLKSAPIHKSTITLIPRKTIFIGIPDHTERK
jgi:hypothetical protein